jgi:hypothetical protein
MGFVPCGLVTNGPLINRGSIFRLEEDQAALGSVDQTFDRFQ